MLEGCSEMIHYFFDKPCVLYPIYLKLYTLIHSLRLLLKDLTKLHAKVKSGDLSIMHDNNVMPRLKLSSD